MSECPFSNASNKTQLSSLLLSDFLNICLSVMSHPLYFSYFIFFSPYLVKLLYFLSPLFFTTILLILALLTIPPNLVQDKSNSEFSNSKPGFLLNIYQIFSRRIGYNLDQKDGEFGYFVLIEAYKEMLETSIFEALELETEDYSSEASQDPSGKCSNQERESVNSSSKNSISNFGENPVEINITKLCEDPSGECSSHDHKGGNLLNESSSSVNVSLEENPVEIDAQTQNGMASPEAKTLGSFFQEKTESEDVMMCEKEEHEVKPLDTEFNKVKERKEKPSIRSGSKVKGNRKFDAKVCPNWDEHFDSIVDVNSPRIGSNYASPNCYEQCNFMHNSEKLGSFGSMRKEKEWTRTLACKLFEERHNAGCGEEGMDLLWETYENESNKSRKKGSSKKVKKGGVGYNEDEEQEEEEEEDMDGKLCCLQALKFSTGKMNLGMGRPNLVKISKALKGIGWLHNVTKHGKKVYH